MNSSNLAFGLRLRAQRERRGITHEAIADLLKTKRSLLVDLERGDLSRWPTGLYRRALFRQYAKAIGLPVPETLEEFSELFVDPSDTVSRTDVAEGHLARRRLRLELASATTLTPSAVRHRIGHAVTELVLILVIGSVAALLFQSPFWTTCGIVALVWYPITSAIGHPLSGLMTPARLRRIWALATGRWHPAAQRTSRPPSRP